VILSMQLGFAVIPLIHFVSDKVTMGEFAIKLPTKILSWIVAIILVSLNLKLLIEQAIATFREDGANWSKFFIILGGLIFTWLFLTMTLLPIFRRRTKQTSVLVHDQEKLLQVMSVPAPKKIAVALDFSDKDEKTIAYALAQGKKDAIYFLLHVVETASTALLGTAADDYETRDDKNRIELYANQLKALGYQAEGILGYRNRVNEIVRIVHETKSDFLVMGAHQHSGLKDILYGETVDQVRHKLSIPVLIVN
jgi:manganese transport protein